MALRVLLLASLVTGAADSGIRDAIRNLSSPFEEERTNSVQALAAAGERAEPFLLSLYPDADFRTKALILDVFAETGRPAAVKLVLSDIAIADRGVVKAQRRAISSIYGAARDSAARELVPLLSADDWRREEALRALPGPGPTPTRVLGELRNSDDSAVRRAADRVAERVRVVSDFREKLARLRGEDDEIAARRARDMSLHLLRHDTERAFLAVQESGSEGNYEGMYGIAGELVKAGGDGEQALSVLLRIVTEDPAPEGGVPPDSARPYRFLEPVPLDLDPVDVQIHAAQCLGDIAGGRAWVAEGLETWLRDDSDRHYATLGSPDFYVAMALAALGRTGPLRTAIRAIRGRLDSPFLYDEFRGALQTRIATARSRLGEGAEAAREYREYLDMYDRADPVARYNLACILAKAGLREEALEALARAIDEGYGLDRSSVGWLLRDGDLDSLRDSEEFPRLVERARHRWR